jgi:hypothetical protein
MTRVEFDRVAERYRQATREWANLFREVWILRLSAIWTRLRLQSARCNWVWIKSLRRFFAATMTVAGGYIFAIAVAAGLGLLAPSISGASWPTRLAAASMAGILVGVRGLPLLMQPDKRLRANCDRSASTYDDLITILRIKESQYSKASEARRAARRALDEARQFFNRRLDQLRAAPWRGMTGVDLEHFLAAVFREWGYQVQTTRPTGDQGLI